MQHINEVKRMQYLASIRQINEFEDQSETRKSRSSKDVTRYVRKWRNNYWVLAVDHEAEGEFDMNIAEPGDTVTWNFRGRTLTGVVTDEEKLANLDSYYRIATDSEEIA